MNERKAQHFIINYTLEKTLQIKVKAGVKVFSQKYKFLQIHSLFLSDHTKNNKFGVLVAEWSRAPDLDLYTSQF